MQEEHIMQLIEKHFPHLVSDITESLPEALRPQAKQMRETGIKRIRNFAVDLLNTFASGVKSQATWIDTNTPPEVGKWIMYDEQEPLVGGRSSTGVFGIVEGEYALIRYEETTDDGGKTVSSVDWTLLEWAEQKGRNTHVMCKPTKWLKLGEE